MTTHDGARLEEGAQADDARLQRARLPGTRAARRANGRERAREWRGCVSGRVRSQLMRHRQGVEWGLWRVAYQRRRPHGGRRNERAERGVRL